MGRSTGITILTALGLLLSLAACAPGPAERVTEPEETFEGSDAPWDAARLAGAGFRASGNEPGWLVEIYPDSLVFVTSYGEEHYRFPDYTATDAEPFVYEASRGGHEISVTLTDTLCLDDMSGKPFETTVTIVFDEQTLRGCGRPLD